MVSIKCSLLVLMAAHALGHTGYQPDLEFPWAGIVAGTDTHPETCWERCFQVEDNDEERFREIYDDLYRMGMEGRRLKNLYAINGTALLLDSTLAAFHDTAVNLDMEDQAENIWQLQKDLASILAFLIGTDNDHNPFYIVQFNEESAYSCDELHCLDACEADELIQTQLDPLQTGLTSHREGNAEAACAMAKRYLQSTECTATLRNEMAVAVLNSDAWTKLGHDSSSSSSSSSSSESMEYSQGPCYAHFDTRYAIGTHAAGWEEIQNFNSRAAKGFYMHDNEYTMKAAMTLRACLQKRCCTPTSAATFWTSGITLTNCKITQGRYGETETAYSGFVSGP